MKKGKRGIACITTLLNKSVDGKTLCAIAIALLIFSFSPFTFLSVSAATRYVNKTSEVVRR